MKDFLLITFGSSGDVNPFVGLGSALKARGHRVTLATNPYFEALIRKAGLDFIPIGTEKEFRETLEHPDLWHPTKGLRFVIQRGMLPVLRPSYDIAKKFSESTGGTVVASMLALGARIAQEKHGLPFATVHLQPQVFPSLIDTPIYAQGDFSRWPKFAKKILFYMGGVGVNRLLAPDFNNFRRELGLPPIYHVFDGWAHSPTLTLGLWPEWFAAPQADWPPHVHLTHFPLFDAGTLETLDPELDAFLQQGTPPVIFTPGSAMSQGNSFFRESIKACDMIGRRGILLTKFADSVPLNLPPTIRRFGYVPFSQVLPKACAFVHHGGIGTTAQALAAGIPQLVMPLSHDQPDNAARVKALGAGLVLPAKEYKAEKIATLLHTVLEDPLYTERSLAIQQHFTGIDPWPETCRLLEAI